MELFFDSPFSTFKRAVQLFKSPDKPAPKIIEFAQRVQSSQDNNGQLGFRKKLTGGDTKVIVRKALEETGHSPSDRELDETIKYLHETEKISEGKRRFYMQSVISAIALIIIGAELYSNSDQTTQKALFGLLGTIIGYWLR